MLICARLLERRRTTSTAGTGDVCDAEITEKRLAMELPRHNWLANLIKENKIKVSLLGALACEHTSIVIEHVAAKLAA